MKPLFTGGIGFRLNISVRSWSTSVFSIVDSLRVCNIIYEMMLIVKNKNLSKNIHDLRKEKIRKSIFMIFACKLTSLPALLLWRFMARLGSRFFLTWTSTMSIKSCENQIPYEMGLLQPPHFHPSSVWPRILLSHRQCSERPSAHDSVVE